MAIVEAARVPAWQPSVRPLRNCVNAGARPSLGACWKDVLDLTKQFHKNRNMEEKIVIASLAALAQSARLRVFRALIGAAPRGMTPGDLAAMLDLPAPTLSFHLKELAHAGLVSAERDGRNLYYRPQFKRMNALIAYLTHHCCQGQACADVPARRRTHC